MFTTPAPSLGFSARRYRLGSGYGPMSLPQGNGAPAVPTAQKVLFDWDPSFDPFVDRAGGIRLTEDGTGVSLEVQRGRPCGVFDGSGSLVGAGSPFAALADLTGGASMYVVCERTDGDATGPVIFEVHNDDGLATNLGNMFVGLLSGDSATLGSYDSGGAGSDSETGFTRNSLEIISGHFTATENTARLNGTGTATAATISPTGLTDTIIGATALFTATPPRYSTGAGFIGRIWRILVIEGAYEAAVLSYLQGLYTQGKPRIPDGVAESDVLMVYDPEWSRLNEWAGDQTLTMNGTVTWERRGSTESLAARFTAGSYLRGTPPLTDFTDEYPITVYAVGEVNSSTSAAIGYMVTNSQNGGFTSRSWSVALRLASGASYSSVRDLTGSNFMGSGESAGTDTVHRITAELTDTTNAAYQDGVGLSQASDKVPDVLDNLDIGGVGDAAGEEASTVYYAIMVRGERSTDVEAWLAANFPVGEDLAPSSPSLVGTSVGTIGSNTVSVTLPSGIEAGDTILLFHQFRVGSVGQTGYTTSFSRTTGDGSLAVYTKTAAGTESGTTVTTDNDCGAGSSQTIHAAVVRNVDTFASAGGDNSTWPAAAFTGEGYVFRTFVSYRTVAHPTGTPTGTTELSNQTSTGVVVEGWWSDTGNPITDGAASVSNSDGLTFGADTATFVAYLAS